MNTEHGKLNTLGTLLPKTENPASPRPFLSRGLAAIAVVMLSVGGFLSLRDSGHTPQQSLIAAVKAERSESASTPQYLSKDISDLQVMQDRVLADDPLDEETEIPLGEINPADWRVVVIAPGSFCNHETHKTHENRRHLPPQLELRILLVVRIFRGIPDAPARHRIPATALSSRRSSVTRTPRFSICGLKAPAKPLARPHHTRSGTKTVSSS